jgi:signal transduction histidine kinase
MNGYERMLAEQREEIVRLCGVLNKWSIESLEQREEIERLRAAGDRIIALISRISDQATDEQRLEHDRSVAALRQIWSEAITCAPPDDPDPTGTGSAVISSV